MRFRLRGFSLIELMMVLLILSVVLAAVTLRIQGPLHQSRMWNVVGQVSYFDRLSRRYAVEQDEPLRMVIDLDENRLYRMDGEDEKQLGSAVVLPTGFALSKVKTREEERTEGVVEVRVSRSGLSSSYAVRVSGPNERSRWLLFSGLTGEMLELEDESAVRDILEATGPRRHAR